MMRISYFFLTLLIVFLVDADDITKPKSSGHQDKPKNMINSHTLKYCQELAKILLPNGIELLDHHGKKPSASSKDMISSHSLKHCEALAGILLPKGKELLNYLARIKLPNTQLFHIGGPVDRTNVSESTNTINPKKISEDKTKNKKSMLLSSLSNRCKPSKKCKEANGKCLSKENTCDGKIIGKGCKPNKGCKKTHVCCAQPPSCSKPKGPCKKAGGKCISKHEDCPGKLISKGCNKKEGCRCCVEKEEECRDTTFNSCSNLGSWLDYNNGTGVCQKPSEPCDGDQFLGQCEGNDCVCCAKGICPSLYYKCNLYTEPSGEYEFRCLRPEQVCDGIVDCRLGDDEKSCTFCASDEFRCTPGECVPNTKKCDGTSDCSNNHDEIDCTWSYDGEAGTYGPEQWSILYPNCNSSRQSPISLATDADDKDFDEITFQNYTQNVSAALYVNENHQVIAQLNPIHNLTIQGGGLTSNKVLIGSLFHWGSNSSKGSEHAINNTRYPMEMQLIHIEEGIDPITVPSSTMLLSIMFEISEADNQALAPFIQAASVIAQSDLSWGFGYAVIENLKFSGLLPNNTQEFYRYEGSVSAPPCNENLPWTVFTHTSTVSEKQLNVLRSIEIGNKSIANNFRPLQPINGRPVFLNK